MDLPSPRACGATRGVLLFAHGARDPAWARPFEATAAALRAREPGLAVRLAFLEFMAPDLPGAGRDLADAGCAEVTVVPLFLGAGGHVRKDLPALLARLQAERPGTRFHLAPAVGERPELVEAMAACAQALARDTAPPEAPAP